VRVERVTPTAAYIALPVEPRTFTTLMGQTVTVKAKPKCVAISANSEIPVLNRRAA
jgi:ABC-type Fe3+-hydroxamate transport system substrate-binding protein